MKCLECGFELKESDKFCSECGNPLNKECSGNKSRYFLYKKYGLVISLVAMLVLVISSLLSSSIFNSIDYKLEKNKETTVPENTYYVNDEGNIVVIDGNEEFIVDDNGNKISKNINSREYSLYMLNEMRYSANTKWKRVKGIDSSTFYDEIGNSMTVAGRVYDDKVTGSVVEKFVDEFEESNNCVLSTRNCDICFDVPCSYYYCNKKNAEGQYSYLNLYVFCQGNTMYSICFDYSEKTGKSNFEMDKSYILNDLSFDEITYTEPITSEPPTENTPEANTSEMVDYIVFKAKDNAILATDQDIDDAVEWLKNNIDCIFDNNENMEKTMYYGELLEYKYKGTDTILEKTGWQAFKTVKYVYRGAESVFDTVTVDNYNELKELVNKL